ncbi:HAD-like domain-containing protein [Gigaspora rosea]|uniref:HAD-like domain-containing protein n=1 Tax=Gigaspora rosea TaxID=44941 RepID=A0A397W784_9GLOM|nr:HAD-like domain-containing protein [Gigaspora rosea]
MAETSTDQLISTNGEGKKIDPVITHCIFDLDAEVFAKFGITYTLQQWSHAIGIDQYEHFALLINETGINITIDEFQKERYEMNVKKYPFVKLMPGVMRLVTHLKKHRIPMAIASSSFRRSIIAKTSVNRELFKMFDNVTCGDEVKNLKPAPDLFLAAREAIGNPPTNQCLVFEDSIPGVKAAKNANMKVIWVPDPMVAELYPYNNSADEIIFSLNDFDPTKYGLPPFDEESSSA